MAKELEAENFKDQNGWELKLKPRFRKTKTNFETDKKSIY